MLADVAGRSTRWCPCRRTGSNARPVSAVPASVGFPLRVAGRAVAGATPDRAFPLRAVGQATAWVCAGSGPSRPSL